MNKVVAMFKPVSQKNINSVMQTKDLQPKGFSYICHIAGRIINRDREYLTNLMREIGSVQPFFTSAMMESVSDLKREETEELLTLYLVVWGIYRQYSICHADAVTLRQFERIRKRNISMFNYLGKEDDNTLFGEVVSADNQKLEQVALMKYVSHCYQTQPALGSMNPDAYCTVLIDLKSFIECLEETAESREQRA